MCGVRDTVRAQAWPGSAPPQRWILRLALIRGFEIKHLGCVKRS